MPVISGLEMAFVGEDVLWHAQGKKVGRGNLAKVLDINPTSGSVTICKYQPSMAGGQVVKDVPYITDKRLAVSPDAAKFAGCWEHSPLWLEIRLLFARVADLERRAGLAKPAKEGM